MRLGLIGPCDGDKVALRERASFVLDTLQVDRAVYLGIDGALDDVVHRWAAELVDGDPSDQAVWTRAARVCARAGSEAIDAFLSRERHRGLLKMLECLPRPDARTIEIFEGAVTVIIYDKALLDEEDILPATVLVFGKSREPLVHKVGGRTFVSPGPTSHPKGGVALLAEENDELIISIHGPDGTCVTRQSAAQLGRAMRMTVQGAALP